MSSTGSFVLLSGASYGTKHLIPLSQVEVSEDFSHYTRDPDQLLKRQRLMLAINEKRPSFIY